MHICFYVSSQIHKADAADAGTVGSIEPLCLSSGPMNKSSSCYSFSLTVLLPLLIDYQQGYVFCTKCQQWSAFSNVLEVPIPAIVDGK